MPHCIIDYSDNLESITGPEKLMEVCQKALVSSDLFPEAAIKVRAKKFDHYIVPKYNYFIYVEVKLLSGRSIDQKTILSGLIKEAIDGLGISNLSLSVDISDMQKECYIKTPS